MDKIDKNTKILENLNDEQLKAVTFGPPTGGGPLLIIAGAGTGKTTVITRRIGWLIEQGLAKPEEILALTFTEKAATEMEERVDQLMPLGYVDINISTFHSFAQKILLEHALELGLPGDFKVLTDTQAWILIKNNLSEFDLNYYKPLGNPNRFIHSLVKHFHKAKGEGISPEDYLKFAQDLRLSFDKPEIKKKGRKSKEVKIETKKLDENEAARISEVANAYHYYQKLLLENGFLDFGDLINYTLKLFVERPKILEYYQNKFKYILIDEFQDTDLSQYELVKLLSKPQDNITVVGDDDQSIYKFRGASISNILKFKEDYPQTREITLVENYRSIQKILDLSYNFIQLNNPERLETKLKISKKLNANWAFSGDVNVLHTSTVFEEARLVVEKIIKLQEKEKFSFNDFAILVRANDHAEPFLNELTRRGLPYIFVANRGLYKKPFILDLLSYLRLLDNHHEVENLVRVINFKKFRISDDDLIAVFQTAKRKALSVFEVLKEARIMTKLSADSLNKIDSLLLLLNKHAQLARSIPATELVVRTLTDLDLIQELADDTLANVENRDLLEQFYKKCQSFEQDSDDKSVKAFLNQIKLELEAGDQGELSFNPNLGPDAVKVLTVHSAKGLEFTCVFIVNLVEQRFPSRDRKEQIEIPEKLVKEILPEGDVHLMEERRLFYVASTRAKRYLFYTWADDYGGVLHKKPSRFLVETGFEEKPEKSKPTGTVFFIKQPELIKTKPNLKVPDSFSFTQLSTFLHCPLEYKYKYLYHLPFPGEPQLSFGITMHKTLEKFLQAIIQQNTASNDLFGKAKKNIEIPKVDVLKKFYEESWVDDWFIDKNQKQDYYKTGLKILAVFYEQYSKNIKPIKFLERSFKLKIGDHKFTGKIDRGDLNEDGSIDIIDYKTGQVREKLSPVDKQQLLIYQWAAEEEFKEKVRCLKYWYLTGSDDFIEFLGKPKDIEELKDKLLEIINKIIEAVNNNDFLKLDLQTSHDCKYRYLER